MTNLERLFAFFDAENKGDWQTYQTFLSDQVYQNNPVQFRCTYYQLSPDQNRIVTLLENDFGDLSCDIFFFEKGLIVKEIEYLLKKAD